MEKAPLSFGKKNCAGVRNFPGNRLELHSHAAWVPWRCHRPDPLQMRRAAGLQTPQALGPQRLRPHQHLHSSPAPRAQRYSMSSDSAAPVPLSASPQQSSSTSRGVSFEFEPADLGTCRSPHLKCTSVHTFTLAFLQHSLSSTAALYPDQTCVASNV
eukprot:1142151-Pelagomonas_calceolata.AAC.4